MNNLEWLDGDITYIHHDYWLDKTTVFFQKDKENKFQELTKEDFKPYIWIASSDIKKFNKLKHSKSYREVKKLKKEFGDKAFLLKPDTQFLNQVNINYFENISLHDLKCVVFDIETTSLDPEDGEILTIGIKIDDKIIFFDKKENGERSMLLAFKNFILEEDPDLLIGHNIFNFDLPYIITRMEKHGIKLDIGKFNGECVRDFTKSKINPLVKGMEFFQYRIPGRYIIDTMHLAIIEDVRRNEFESYSLKYLASILDIAPKDRVYIEGEEISKIYHDDYNLYCKYLKDDLSETEGLMKLFLPAYVQMSKRIPIDLQSQIYAGPTTKFHALMSKDYYHGKKMLPMPQAKKAYQGATSEVIGMGIFKNIAKYDVASLYPSIQEVYNVFPKSDTLGSMKNNLLFFKTERLRVKELAKKEEDLIKEGKGSQIKYEEYHAYQLALKILINSFYGVLGNGYFCWNDYDAAAKITKKGREILSIIMDEIVKSGCILISVDTDGAYFSYPETVDPQKLLDHINNVLDEGINVEFEKSWPKMISHAGKNYAVLSDNNILTKKGSAFKNRGLPPFLKKFMQSFLYNALTDRLDKYENDYFLLKRAIADRTINIEELVTKKTISYNWQYYINRDSGGKIAHFEAMEKANRTEEFKAGDKVHYYYSGDKLMKTKTEMVCLYDKSKITNKDYNVDYYIDMLNQWDKVFRSIINRTAPKNV